MFKADAAAPTTGRGGGKKILPLIILLGFSILLPVLLLEGVLRLFPALISESVLVEFPKELRREVAARLGLPLKQARHCLSSSERLDRGPELCLAQPDFNWLHKLDAVDRKYGAEEQILQDGNGFCNIAAKAGRSQQEILFIGDSFTWCWTVKPEQTFSALLESQVGKSTYNLGFPGVGPYEYLEILKRSGLEYAPRVVVMNIYEGNDLRDGERYWKHVNERQGEAAAGTVRGGDERHQAALSKRLLNSSFSLSFIAASIEAAGKRFFSTPLNFAYRVKVRGEDVQMNVANADRDEVKSARHLREGKSDLSVWRDALAEFVRLGNSQGFRPVVTYIPSAYTAYADSVVFEDEAVGRDVAYLSSRQRAYLKRLADELGFTFLDLTEYLQQAVSTAPLAYFPGSVHLTQQGHMLIARALAPLLQQIAESTVADGALFSSQAWAATR